jgi:hypothetical protein
VKTRKRQKSAARRPSPHTRIDDAAEKAKEALKHYDELQLYLRTKQQRIFREVRQLLEQESRRRQQVENLLAGKLDDRNPEHHSLQTRIYTSTGRLNRKQFPADWRLINKTCFGRMSSSTPGLSKKYPITPEPPIQLRRPELAGRKTYFADTLIDACEVVGRRHGMDPESVLKMFKRERKKLEYLKKKKGQ